MIRIYGLFNKYLSNSQFTETPTIKRYLRAMLLNFGEILQPTKYLDFPLLQRVWDLITKIRKAILTSLHQNSLHLTSAHKQLSFILTQITFGTEPLKKLFLIRSSRHVTTLLCLSSINMLSKTKLNSQKVLPKIDQKTLQTFFQKKKFGLLKVISQIYRMNVFEDLVRSN